MEVGPLLGLWLQSFLIHVTIMALSIIIFVIVYGRIRREARHIGEQAAGECQ